MIILFLIIAFFLFAFYLYVKICNDKNKVFEKIKRINNGHCPECNYSMRGLPTTRCPECGNSSDDAWDVANIFKK